MSRQLRQVAAVAALALVAGLPTAPAYAADSFTIGVDPLSDVSGATLTVDGDVSPDCAGTFTVIFSYTNADGAVATVVTSADLNPVESVFSVPIVIPEDARWGTADEAPASVSATATCAGEAPTPSSPDSIEILIAPHDGELTVTPAEVGPGDTLTVAGTECYGGSYDVFIYPVGADLDDVDVAATGTLADGVHDFTVDIPVADDVAPGEYTVNAFCAGSSTYEGVLAIAAGPNSRPTPRPTPTASNPTPTSGAAAPAVPVAAQADFTG